MPDDYHFTIAGEKWLLRFTKLRGRAEGWTYFSPPGQPRKLLVDSRLTRRPKLETVIHEVLHALNPTASEEHVTLSARDLARVLWALGYREIE